MICCHRALIVTRCDFFQLDSEFKDGTALPGLRETADVPAKLLTNHLTGVQSNSRATSLLDAMACRARSDRCKRFENSALILLVNAMAMVFHNHGEERRGVRIMPCLVFESGAGNANYHSAVWRIALASIYEDVKQDLLVLYHVTQKFGVTEAILFVCGRYFYVLLPAEKLDDLGYRLSRLL